MKTSSGFRILALEPDPGRAEALERLIRERVGGDVTVVNSSRAAIASLSCQVPDLVVTSAFVSPSDDEQLVAHLNQRGDTHDVPILTVHPIFHDEPSSERPRGPLSLLRPRRAPRLPSYDDVVSDRIADAAARARALAINRARNIVWEGGGSVVEMVNARPLLSAEEPRTAMVPAGSARERRDRAPRWVPNDIPWLGAVQTPWGLDLRLLNISASGLLVESASKFMPNSFSELHLLGSDRRIVVPARLVRSEVAEVNTLGVKYRTAVVFGRTLDLLLAPRQLSRTSSATPQALVELLMRVTAAECVRDIEGTRLLFEEGLRTLVPAREIQIRPRPAASAGGDSVYFTVPTGDMSQPVLQVTFEPDYEPEVGELSLLKAAASLAAVVLQHERKALPGERNAW